MTVVLLDVFQSTDMEVGLRRWGLDIQRRNLVPHGLGDIVWLGYDGSRFSLEHKKVGALLSEMGQRLDDQLLKHLQNASHVGLLIEGFATPGETGGCQLWKEISNKRGDRFMIPVACHPMNYEAYRAYLWSLENRGIHVYEYPDLSALCLGVATYIQNTQKSSHKSLSSFHKTRRFIIGTGDETRDRYIKSLMGLDGVRIGQKTAELILENFQTPYRFFTADPDTATSVVGKAIYLSAMKAIGRIEDQPQEGASVGDQSNRPTGQPQVLMGPGAGGPGKGDNGPPEKEQLGAGGSRKWTPERSSNDTP